MIDTVDNTLPGEELPPEQLPADPDAEPTPLPTLEPVPPGGNERGVLPPSAL
jgi:hypothetical protein